jgi:hypothetical protein
MIKEYNIFSLNLILILKIKKILLDFADVKVKELSSMLLRKLLFVDLYQISINNNHFDFLFLLLNWSSVLKDF